MESEGIKTESEGLREPSVDSEKWEVDQWGSAREHAYVERTTLVVTES